MKHFKHILILCLLFVVQYIYADNFTVNKLVYSSSNSNLAASVSSCNISSGSVVIPEKVTYNGVTYTVTGILAKAFYNKKISSITIPSTVKSIGNDAFDGCSALTAVHISSLESWCDIPFDDGSRYFYYNNPLIYAHKLYLNGEELTNLVLPKGLKSVSKQAFYGCTSIQTLTLNDELESIGSYAFYRCTSLKQINFSSNLQVVNDNAFAGCTSLQSAEFPESVKYLGEMVMSGCTSLETLILPNNIYSIYPSSFSLCTNLTKVELPGNLALIGYNAFSECSSLTSIDIPESVMAIGQNAFYKCTSLTRVNINSLTSWATIDFGDEGSNPCSYAHSLYVDGQEVTELTIPATVPTIKKYAWTGLNNLQKVTVPNGITSIGDYAFTKCGKLSRISLPNTLTTIGSAAFSRCSSLDSVFIPQSVTNMSSYVFHYCTTLTDLSFASDDLTMNPVGLFAYCKNLQTIRINCLTPPTLSTSGSPFQSVPETCKIYVPQSAIARYKTAESWSNFTIEALKASSLTIKGDADLKMSRPYGDEVTVHLLPADNYTVSKAMLNDIDITENFIDNQYTPSYLIGDNILNVEFIMQAPDLLDYGICGTCKWEIDNDGVMTISPLEGDSGTLADWNEYPAWYLFEDSPHISSVRLEGDITALTGSSFFLDCNGIPEIDLTLLSTDSVTNMQNMFENCESLTNIDLSNFKTSSVTNMERMFSSCRNLKILNMSNFDMGKVTGMDNLFAGCSSLSHIYSTVTTPSVLQDGTFSSLPTVSICKLYVPASSKTDYEAATGWKELNNIVGVENGDVNLDLKVNITDAVEIVNNVLGDPSEKFTKCWSDVNHDDQYTIADASAVLNVILGEAIGTSGAKSLRTNSDAGHLTLRHAGTDLLTVGIDSSVAYTAFQFDVTLPDAMSLDNVVLNKNRCEDFSVMFRKVSDGKYTVAVFNLDNHPFATGTGSLLNLTTGGICSDGDIILSNIHFATTSALDIQFPNMRLGVATGITDVNPSTDIECNSIYDLSGRKLRQLQKGVNIVNGKKVLK